MTAPTPPGDFDPQPDDRATVVNFVAVEETVGWYPIECEHGFDACPRCGDGATRPDAGVAPPVVTPAELDAVRARAKAPLHAALHGLDVRITGLAGDCHCNLVAEVALDAVEPALLALVAELTRERDEARRQADYAGRLVDEAVLPGAIAAAEARGWQQGAMALRAKYEALAAQPTTEETP